MPSLNTLAPAPTDAQAASELPTPDAAAPDPAASATSDAATSTSTAPSADPPLSKSALKRQRKQEAFQAQKLQRRAYEKEKRKAKAAEVKRLVAEGKMDKPVNKKRPRGKQEPHGARIAIDLGFDELMTEKEVKSMASQVAYCYSANRAASHPFPLLLTSFNGRLRESYEKRGDHVSWKGVEWWEEGIEELYEGVAEPAAPAEAPADDAAPAEQPAASTSAEPALASPPTVDSAAPDSTALPSVDPSAPSEAAPAPTAPTASAAPLVSIGSLAGTPRARVPRSTVVYLTGDSPNVLTTLEAGHTYILGGIVDRNRYKNLCLHKAERLGIAHAQLPIGEFLPEMQTRKVLTVNQVYEILVGWVEEGGRADGWREALRRAMPERKFDPDSRKKRRRGADGAEEGEGGDDGVYIARDEDDDGEEMLVEQVDEARGAAEGEAEQGGVAAVLASVDAEAKP
ncbi:tRNA (guanine(9)-N(1))-methyltransferase [Rhodotorula kratochvilovae]